MVYMKNYETVSKFVEIM